MGKPRPETGKTRACRHRPPARERQVSQECRDLLRDRFFAVQLRDFKEMTALTAGTLVFWASEYVKPPVGVDPGLPDLIVARVGYWGLHGCELKERGPNGQCNGRCSTEQLTAEASGLYIVAWAPEHLVGLITELDRKAGYGRRARATTEK